LAVDAATIIATTIGTVTTAEKIKLSTIAAPNRVERSAGTSAGFLDTTSRTLARGGAYGFAVAFGLGIAAMFELPSLACVDEQLESCFRTEGLET
jgi:hypothetical protein